MNYDITQEHVQKLLGNFAKTLYKAKESDEGSLVSSSTRNTKISETLRLRRAHLAQCHILLVCASACSCVYSFSFLLFC